jgi:hypothetical protein
MEQTVTKFYLEPSGIHHTVELINQPSLSEWLQYIYQQSKN